MKKVFLTLAVAAMMACGLTSCSDKEGCWEITVKSTVSGVNASVSFYVWGTRDDVNSAIEKAKENGATATVTKKKVNKSESDCL